MTTSGRVRAARDLQAFLGRRDTGRGAGAAATVLESLRVVAPFDCGNLLSWDAGAGRHTTLGSLGFRADVASLGESREHLEPTFRYMLATRGALRWRDIPARQRRGGEFWEAVVHASGFTDAVAMPLWAADGRFVGTVNAIVMGARSQPDDLAVDLLALLAPGLAGLLDRIPRQRPVTADLVEGRAEGVVVTRTGRARALTAAADTRLARPGGPLWPVIHPVADGPRDAGSALVLVGDRVLAVSVHAGDHGALVLYRTADAPFGLSVRELQILDALAGGATNAQLAARLGIARRTVATHVERLLAKTGCPNRTSAARLATRLNLHT